MTKPLQKRPKSTFWSKINGASLDFNGSVFQLEFASNNGKFQTRFGGYLSLVVSFTTVLAFILIISQLFSNNSPVVNTSEEFNPEYVSINLYDEDLIGPFMFKKGNKMISSVDELSRYVTVQSQTMDWRQNKTTKWWSLNSTYKFPLAPCKQAGEKNIRTAALVDKLFPNAKDIQKYLFCLNLGNLTEVFELGVIYNNLDLKYMDIRFFPCSLADPTKCATTTELSDFEVTIFRNKKFWRLRTSKSRSSTPQSSRSSESTPASRRF